MSIRMARIAATLTLVIMAVGMVTAHGDSDEQDDLVVIMARNGAALYAALEMAPIESAAALLTQLQQHAVVVEHAALTRGQREALLGENAAFLWLYFGQSNPDAYIQWRRYRGYVPQYDVHRVYRTYESLFDRPMPRTQPHAQTFREFWAARHERFDGVNRAVVHAAEPCGIHVVVGEVTKEHPHHLQPLTGTLGIEHWHGGIAHVGRAWWKLRRALDQDTLLAAQLGIVLGFADGSRRPILVYWLYDEQSKAWRLISMNVANTVDYGVLAGEF